MATDPFSLVRDAMRPRDTMAEVFATLGYVPTPRQFEFHHATEHDVLYGGAAGGGKTAALVAEALRRCVEVPGLRVGAFRRTYDELSESLLHELGRLGFAEDLGARWNGSERELRFPNGSLIRFRYAENLVDASRRQGGEYQLLILDERTLFAPGVVSVLRERLRSGRAAIPVVGIRSGTNPGGADHAAVRSRFIDATDHGSRTYIDEQGFTVRFVPAKVDDNPHLDAAYVRTLDSIPDPARRAAMRDGSWDVFAGQVFTEWQRDRHVVPRFDLPKPWPRYAGIDWGHRAPWAVEWAAVDEDGRVWVYDELYATQVGEEDQARRILERERPHPAPVARYADDAMFAGRGAQRSVAQAYAAEGALLQPAHKGERLTGWQRVHSFLGDAPACLQHRDLGWTLCPRLHVLDGAAPNLVRTLPALTYDPPRAEDVDSRAEDHAPDALRYLLINIGEPTIAGWLDPEPTAAPDPFSVHPLDEGQSWWAPDDVTENAAQVEFWARVGLGRE